MRDVPIDGCPVENSWGRLNFADPDMYMATWESKASSTLCANVPLFRRQMSIREGRKVTMKAIFFVFSLLAALTLVVVPSHALIGIEDNAPGYDVLVPFFLVSMPGFGSTDTVIVITETCKSAVNFAYNVYDRNGILINNDSIGGTQCDVVSISASNVVQAVSPFGRAQLEIDLDADGTNDHYSGFINFLNTDTVTPKNHVTAMVYQVDFQNGVFAGTNIPAREYSGSTTIDPALIDPVRGTERFSANALYRAQQYIDGETTIIDASNLHLMARYLIMDAQSKTYWFIWTNMATPLLHVNWLDEDENVMSANLPALTAGLNIIDVELYLPIALHGVTYPKGGWVDISMPDIGGAGFDGDREMVAYSYQLKPVAPGCGDPNGNGIVDIGDAMFIAQQAVGNRDCICAGTPAELCGIGSTASSESGWASLTQVHKEAGN